MNINGFQALCCEAGGYAQLLWEYPSENKFSICVRFLPDALTVQGSLFSIGGVLFVNLDGRRIRLMGDGFDYLSGEILLLQRCRNTVIAVYDGETLSVYCNGALALQQAVPLNLSGLTNLRLGENLSSVYIHTVTIFHDRLEEQMIKSSQAVKFSGYQKQVDFSMPTASSDAVLHCCEIKDCVYTLDCSHGKLTVPCVQLPQEYTLTFSFYAFRHKYGGTLFQSPRMCIKLCDDYSLGAPKVSIEHDGRTHRTLSTVKTNQWTTLTVVFGSSRIKVYFDGEIKHEISYSSSSEAGDIEFGQFDGYLDSCAIIKGALAPEEISGYVNQPPDVFDKDVLYQFPFSDKLLQEGCHGTAMVPSGAEIILVRGTGAGSREDNSRHLAQSSRTYSDFVVWQVHLPLCLLSVWIHTQLGVYPNRGIHMESDAWKIDGDLQQFVHKEILPMKETQMLECHYNRLNAQELLNFIRSLTLNGILKKLMDYLFQEDLKQAVISDILMAMLAAWTAAELLAELGKAIDNMPPISKPPKPSPDAPEEDDGEKKTYVFIEKTVLKGDLNIEFEGEDILQDCEKAAVFFANGNIKNAGLEVSLSYTGADGAFTVFAENPDGKIIPSSQRNVLFKGKQPVKISLDVHREKFGKRYGKCTETLCWRCESSDGKQAQFLGETEHVLYFLENAPCKLWNNTVHIECLELCADCAEYAGENSEGFVMDYARFMKENNAGNGNPEDSAAKKSYSQLPALDSMKFIFDAVNFARDYRRGCRSISYKDIIYSNAIFAYLNGYADMDVLWLSANMSYRAEDDRDAGVRLLIRDSEAGEGFVCLEGSIHYIMKDGEGRIYDPKLNSYKLSFSDDSKREITGMHNPQYYRESQYLEGSYCEIICSIGSGDWVLDKLPAVSAEHLGIVGWVRHQGGRYVYAGRTDSDRAVWEYIRRRDGDNDGTFEAVCHSISSFIIDGIIADICNDRLQDNLMYLQNFVNALYPGMGPEDEFTHIYHRSTEHILNCLSRCLAHGNVFTDEVIMHCCRLAANSPGNLRMGAGKWNNAIREAFDPQAWFYYGNPNAERVVSDYDIHESCEAGQLLRILRGRYGDMPNPQDGRFAFYLPKGEDGVRIRRLLACGHRVNILCKRIFDEGLGYCPFICSSSNKFVYREIGDRYDAVRVNIPIYYLNEGNQWVLL